MIMSENHIGIMDPTSPVATLYNVYMPKLFYISDFNSDDFEERITGYHAHNYWQLFYVNSGYIRHNVFGATFRQERGSFVIIPPFCKHQIDSRECAANVIQLEMSNDFMSYSLPKGGDNALLYSIYMEPLANNIKSTNPLILFEHGSILQKAEELLDNLKKEFYSLNRQSVLQAHMINLFSLIFNKYISTKTLIDDNNLYQAYRRNIHNVLEYIDENFKKSISSEKIYRVATMSSSSFSYMFKSVTGMTLVDYINLVRINRAQHLLIEDEMPITNVAIDCGFKNLVTFDRTFKRVVGVSPSTYIANQPIDINSNAGTFPIHCFEPVERYIQLAQTIDFK